jgi:multisubunit Na+/H+ antiporter MnhB subunit
MTLPELLFDGCLAIAILATAWLLLASPGFPRAVVLFITFGLLMSLAWVRLMAPDIALAEAAIGTGITGVLLMDTLRHMQWKPEAWRERWPHPRPTAPALARIGEQALPSLATAAMAGLLLAGVARLAAPDPAMAALARENMRTLEHPVTAVLLVFRGLDTLLELAVLLLALLGVLTVRGRFDLAAETALPPQDPVLEGIVRVLVPLAVLAGGYFLWLGTFAAGGAFQAGVVFGAAGVLLRLGGHRGIAESRPWLWLALVMAGFATFLAVAFATTLGPHHTLELPPRFESAMLQLMEITAAISIGATLTALFLGLHPPANHHPP